MSGGSDTSRALINTFNQSSNGQYWIIKDAGNDYVYVENYGNSNLVIDAPNSANGTIMRVNSFTGSTNQKFKLNKL